MSVAVCSVESVRLALCLSGKFIEVPIWRLLERGAGQVRHQVDVHFEARVLQPAQRHHRVGRGAAAVDLEEKRRSRWWWRR